VFEVSTMFVALIDPNRGVVKINSLLRGLAISLKENEGEVVFERKDPEKIGSLFVYKLRLRFFGRVR
jgi:hypothetical protein